MSKENEIELMSFTEKVKGGYNVNLVMNIKKLKRIQSLLLVQDVQ